MISVTQFKQQPGGLYTAVMPYDRSSFRHRDWLENILLAVIQHEAKVHGARFDPDGFRNVIRAMTQGDVEILFLAAAWDLTKPKIVGATINFRSLFLQRSGNGIIADNGIYSEDVCMMPDMLRLLVAGKPIGAKFPKGGLGAHFIKECMQYFAETGMKGGIKPLGQRFEFLPDNTNITKIQEQLGAVLGADFRNSGLMRFDGITDSIFSKWDMPVELLNIRSADGGIDPNNFMLRWAGQEEHQKIHAGFTRGVRTFVGASVTQSQIVSSGILPEQPIVESALASILKTANNEIQERKWGRVDYWPTSDNSGLLGNAWESLGERSNANDDELFEPSLSAVENAFGVVPPLMHIHALKEPEIIIGLEALGLEKRILGDSPSQTGALNLVEACKNKYPVRPLDLVKSQTANDPIFSLDVA